MSRPRLPGQSAGRYIPAGLRLDVMDRDGGVCVYCEAADDLSLDHVYPWSQGGSTSKQNLVVACMPCNRLAGEKVFADLTDKQDWLSRARAHLQVNGMWPAFVAAVAEQDETQIRGMTR